MNPSPNQNFVAASLLRASLTFNNQPSQLYHRVPLNSWLVDFVTGCAANVAARFPLKQNIFLPQTHPTPSSVERAGVPRTECLGAVFATAPDITPARPSRQRVPSSGRIFTRAPRR